MGASGRQIMGVESQERKWKRSTNCNMNYNLPWCCFFAFVSADTKPTHFYSACQRINCSDSKKLRKVYSYILVNNIFLQLLKQFSKFLKKILWPIFNVSLISLKSVSKQFLKFTSYFFIKSEKHGMVFCDNCYIFLWKLTYSYETHCLCNSAYRLQMNEKSEDAAVCLLTLYLNAQAKLLVSLRPPFFQHFVTVSLTFFRSFSPY